jgi:FAD/FMN-containing dehydrogenase
MHVEAGLPTAHVHRLARENGLWFPPDPGAAEQSLIGGNIATNAGGPHAFKYGTTRDWVMGLEAVVAPGEVVRVGGPLRKDVAGYDLRGLLIGSEGTLGIVTAAWLRLIPAPEAALPVVGLYPDAETGAAAVQNALFSGAVPAALEFLDAGALAAAAGLPVEGGAGDAGFAVLAEADGPPAGAQADRDALAEALAEGALGVHAPEPEALWRWRSGVSHAVIAQRGGKLSEDVAVPLERVRDALAATQAIAGDLGLDACAYGHAGDGNLHVNFLFETAAERDAKQAAVDEGIQAAIDLGGTITGEHGVGLAKRMFLAREQAPEVIALQRRLKLAFDPDDLLNPGKILPL